jgi:hypothetical protein
VSERPLAAHQQSRLSAADFGPWKTQEIVGVEPGTKPSGVESVPDVTVLVDLNGTGSGTVTGVVTCTGTSVTCSVVAAEGSTLSLTATPHANMTFTGWTGACWHSNSTCSFAAYEHSMVKPGGPWDYKKGTRSNTRYEALGNWNLAITGRATGFSPGLLRRGAGAAQVAFSVWNPEWGYPWGGYPYGDDDWDQRWINQGFRYYEGCRKNP